MIFELMIGVMLQNKETIFNQFLKENPKVVSQDYKNFIPLIENNDLMFKLMREIFKLVNEIKKIKQMNFEELTAEFDDEIIKPDIETKFLGAKLYATFVHKSLTN